MARASLLLVAALAIVVALPALPTGQAQAGASQAALAVVYLDDFPTGNTGWSTSSLSTAPAEADGWFHMVDGTGENARQVWTASRSDGSGYDNNAHVRLTSPPIVMPASYLPRSVAITLRGSSAAADILTLEWAPTSDSPTWTKLKTWSGSDIESTYVLVDTTAGDLQGFRGASFFLRLSFDANGTCDSDPGTPAADPQVTGGPDPDNPPGVTGPDPAWPNPDDPTMDPGVGTSGGDPVPNVNPNQGETGQEVSCGNPAKQELAVSTIGWAVDRIIVIARRDFTVAAPPGAPHVLVDAAGSDVAVDMLRDAGKLLEFRIDSAGADYSSVLVRLQRNGASDVMDLATTKTGTIWSGLLSVDEPDLVAGRWTVSYFGVTSSGGSLLGTRILDVGAQDTTAPRLTINPTGDPVHLGPGSLIGLTVIEPFLRKVTYQYEGLVTAIDLPYPYLLSEAALPEGLSTVSFTALDRTGHTATSVVKVDRDTLRPDLSVVAPSIVYAGVPFDLSLKVTERSAHSIHLDVNGTKMDFEVPAGAAADGRTTGLQLTVPDLGNFTVKIAVNDTIGNQVLSVSQFEAVRPVTDLRVSAVRLATPATNIQREGEAVVAVIEQIGGVAPLPVTVTFDTGGQTTSYAVTIPASGPKEVRWNATMLPGMHMVNVHVTGPAIANETLPGNENGSLPVEVFLGRMVFGARTYVIRADTHGLPSVAVLANSTKTYPLKVVDNGRGIAYRFTGEGNKTIDWDPLNPIVEQQSSSASGSSMGAKKPAPALGPLVSVLVVALAAVASRRRKA